MSRIASISPGMKFGRLVVLSRFGVDSRGNIIWNCRCICGKEKVINGCKLRSRNTQSCGCLRLISSKGTKEHTAWQNMIQRCYDKNHPSYKNYGGRGISVCKRWRGSDGFKRFLSDMGQCPPGLTLDRYPDNNGNYEPLNCRWATMAQQQRNKRVNVFLTYGSETKTIADWAKVIGISRQLLRARLLSGRTLEEMLRLS